MKTTNSICKYGVVVDEKTKAEARDAVLIRKGLKNLEQKRIEGYKNLYKAIMKLKHSEK